MDDRTVGGVTDADDGFHGHYLIGLGEASHRFAEDFFGEPGITASAACEKIDGSGRCATMHGGIATSYRAEQLTGRGTGGTDAG
jgi:hypothetical protein